MEPPERFGLPALLRSQAVPSQIKYRALFQSFLGQLRQRNLLWKRFVQMWRRVPSRSTSLMPGMALGSGCLCADSCLSIRTTSGGLMVALVVVMPAASPTRPSTLPRQTFLGRRPRHVRCFGSMWCLARLIWLRCTARSRMIPPSSKLRSRLSSTRILVRSATPGSKLIRNGMAPAVLNFNRLPALVTAFCRRMGAVSSTTVVSLTSWPARGSGHAWLCQACNLLGLRLDPAEEAPMAMQRHFLGVFFNLSHVLADRCLEADLQVGFRDSLPATP